MPTGRNAARSRDRDKAAETLWGQSALQRAGVSSSTLSEQPASLFSRYSYDAERERKRQLISKMVPPPLICLRQEQNLRTLLTTGCTGRRQGTGRHSTGTAHNCAQQYRARAKHWTR